MERKLILISVMVILLTSLLIAAFRVRKVQASGTIYISADGSIEPPTAPISSVDNITYTFTADINGEIEVQRSNIVIDGMGYTVQGTGIGQGIYLSNRGNVTIKNLSIKYFYQGIRFEYSSNNTIYGNHIANNTNGGLWLDKSSNNVISGNNITNNYRGIYFAELFNFYNCSNNVLRNNSLCNNIYNFESLISFSGCIQDIDDSNTVDGKPIYYWINRRDKTVPPDAGYVALVNCTRITVKNLNLTNNGQGILVAFTTNSTISGNSITSNKFGIIIQAGSGNTIAGNDITDSMLGITVDAGSGNTIAGNDIMANFMFGLYLRNSSNNSIYHNNFINNQQVYLVNSANNTWDNGCEGNFWSYYNGVDLDGDGVGDTNLPWRDVDNFPLMNLYWNPGDVDHDLDVDIYDVVKAAVIYGSTPLDPEWNPHCDIAESYGVIDIFDIVTIAMSYGEAYIP